MTAKIEKKKVAILIEKDFEDSEFQIPYAALQEAGAEVTVLGSRVNEKYTGKQGKVSIEADATTTESLARDFDAVVIPGGVAPDKMRTNMKTVRFVADAVEQGKLVAAVCHGPQVLIEGDLLKGKRATGFRAIRKDMQNAGAIFENAPLVVDDNLITSRRPGDVAIFTTAILRRLNLSVKDTTMPDENNLDADWWKLAEAWGGSSMDEIIDGINTAIRGEHYGMHAFEHYAEKVSDKELRFKFNEIRVTKQHHINRLEARLSAIGGQKTFQTEASGAWATLKSWLQSSDDISILRRALGDLQTGVVDTNNLRNSLTDPVTVAIFDEMEVTLAEQEQRIADLYYARVGKDKVKAATPTTGTGA